MADTTIDEIEETFLTLDQHEYELRLKANSDAEKKAIQSARDAARDAFWAARAKDLTDNDPFVAELKKSLKVANAEMKEQIKAMESFTKIIKSINEAVKIAAAIVTLAGP